jgi:hypothetical protein
MRLGDLGKGFVRVRDNGFYMVCTSLEVIWGGVFYHVEIRTNKSWDRGYILKSQLGSTTVLGTYVVIILEA